MENQEIKNAESAVDAAFLERERKQFEKMTKTPIPRLVIGLGIPTMLSMMITSLYNLADTYFVSLIGEDAITAAASNLLALMSIIQAIGFTFGMGAGSLVSRLLGKRDREGADSVASSAFAAAAACGLFILIFGFSFLTPLMKLFGSRSEAVLGYSKQYARFVLLSAPFMCMCFVMNNVLRAEGKAVYSMFGLVAGAVLNVILDPIFIFVADMGISGAGLATCISQMVSFFVLLYVYSSGKTVTRIRLRAIGRTSSVYLEVIKTGFPSFCRQILASLCTVFLNNAANQYGGDAAQAALGVVQKVFMLAFSISLGIGQGYQPVLGYNYSAKRFDRVRSAYIFTWAFATSLMLFFSIFCSTFSSKIMNTFSLSEEATEIGRLALWLQCIMMPLLPLNFMASVTYQVIGKQVAATLLAISRQGMFYIPAVLLLPRFFGLLGVQACQATADFLAFFFAIPFTILFFKMLKREQNEHEASLSK